MNIFILEDDEERVRTFFIMFCSHNIVVSNSAQYAKTILDNEKFDIIFLDHDLGGKTFVDSKEENTGYQVAKHLPKTINFNTRIVVHSWNTPAANLMVKELEHSDEFTGKIEKLMFDMFDKNIIYNSCECK